MRHNLERVGYKELIFDGVRLSDYFVVRSLNMPLLPTIEANTLQVDGKPGAYYMSRSIGTRDVMVGLGILNDTRSKKEIIKAWIDLSDKLDKEHVCKLEIGNGLYVNAALVGDTATTTNGRWSIVDVTFRCFDPYIYGREHTEQIATGLNAIRVISKAKTYPKFELSGATDITLTNNNTGDRIRVPGLIASQKLTIDMANHVCKIGETYKAADPTVSDFWPIAGGDITLNLSAGSGTMTYREAYL